MDSNLKVTQRIDAVCNMCHKAISKWCHTIEIKDIELKNNDIVRTNSVTVIICHEYSCITQVKELLNVL